MMFVPVSCFPRRLYPTYARACLAALFFLLLPFVAPAAATTYYVDAAAPGGDGSSWAQAFATIAAGLTAASQSGDVVEVSGGIYAENLATLRDGVTVAGSTASGHNGSVVISGSDGQTTLTVNHASTWRRLTISNPANTDQTLAVVKINAGAPVFDQCVIGPGQQLLSIGPGGASFSRCTIQGARRGINYGQVVTITAGTDPVTFDYCLFADMQFGYIRPHTASRLDFNNCLLAGFSGYVLYSSADAAIPGGTNLKNCLLFSNGYSATYLIWSETPAAAVNLTNCLTQPRSPVDIANARFSANVTETNPLAPGSPQLTHGRRKALFNLGIDDAAHIDMWTQVAALCNARGIPSTLALDAADVVSDQDWATLQMQVDAGNEVAAHTAHHVVLTEKNLLTITYGGAANNATVTVASTGTAAQTLTLKLGTVVAAAFDLTAASYDTMGKLRDAVAAVPDFSASLVTVAGTSYTTTNVLSRDLDATSQNLPSGTAVTLARNDAQFFADEIAAPKATIEAHLHARGSANPYVCDSFVYPFLDADAQVLAAVGDAGFTAARGGYYGSFAMGGYWNGPVPGGYDVLEMWAVEPGQILGRNLDATTLAQRVSALLEWAKFTGVAIALYSHGATEYDLSEWQALIDLLAADPEVSFGTLQDLRDYVAGNAQSQTGSVYVRTVWPDVADYAPQTGSPLLGAGSPYGRVMRDFAGHVLSAGTIPSVGLYQSAHGAVASPAANLQLLLLTQ
jgi:hypothetical protein